MARILKGTNEKVKGYVYSVYLKSLTDNKGFYYKCGVENKINEDDLKITLEEISDCYVKNISRTTVYKEKLVNSLSSTGVMVLGEYKMFGKTVMTNNLYFPYLKPKYLNYKVLEKKLSPFFGKEFKINNISYR